MKVFRYLSILLIVFVLFSCKKFKGSQEIPAYLRIEPWTLTTDYIIYGAATHAITDAWVYVDGNLLGCYEIQSHDDGMYVMVSVLEKDSHKLQIYPGVKLNGIASTRIQYPFYKPYVITRTLTPGCIDTIRPSTVYYSIDSTLIRFKREAMEDFEDINNIKLDSTSNSKTRIHQISHRTNPNAWMDPNDTLNHYRSGRVQLTDSINIFEIASKELKNLPTVGNYVLLELDYKCDNNFLVGMYIHTPQSGIMDKELYYLKATDVWKKVYLNFSPTVTENFNADYVKFYFRGLQGEADTTNFYYDNLKLIYLDN